jgi:VWFA-related protein
VALTHLLLLLWNAAVRRAVHTTSAANDEGAEPAVCVFAGRTTAMLANYRPWIFLFVLLAFALGCAGKLAGVPAPADSRTVDLDVVVTAKSGAPVPGLEQQDFTVLDNGKPSAISTFAAKTGRDANIEVLIVLDAVNASATNVNYARQEVTKYLRSEGGVLAFPTSVAIFTDTDLRPVGSFTTDGNQLSTLLDQNDVGLRDLKRSSGFYGAEERAQLSLKALDRIAVAEAARPGGKFVLWVSPGWPLLSGASVQLDNKQEQAIFKNIVSMSSQLARARLRLYSIDPLGTADAGSHSVYYKNFLKGVSKPSQTDLGDLGLQVLSTQSGGLALSESNDVSAELRKCVADASAYYEISIPASIAASPNEYHRIEVKLSKPGLTGRTRTGYYAQP